MLSLEDGSELLQQLPPSPAFVSEFLLVSFCDVNFVCLTRHRDLCAGFVCTTLATPTLPSVSVPWKLCRTVCNPTCLLLALSSPSGRGEASLEAADAEMLGPVLPWTCPEATLLLSFGVPCIASKWWLPCNLKKLRQRCSCP